MCAVSLSPAGHMSIVIFITNMRSSHDQISINFVHQTYLSFSTTGKLNGPIVDVNNLLVNNFDELPSKQFDTFNWSSQNLTHTPLHINKLLHLEFYATHFHLNIWNSLGLSVHFVLRMCCIAHHFHLALQSNIGHGSFSKWDFSDSHFVHFTCMKFKTLEMFLVAISGSDCWRKTEQSYGFFLRLHTINEFPEHSA